MFNIIRTGLSLEYTSPSLSFPLLSPLSRPDLVWSRLLSRLVLVASSSPLPLLATRQPDTHPLAAVASLDLLSTRYASSSSSLRSFPSRRHVHTTFSYKLAKPPLCNKVSAGLETDLSPLSLSLFGLKNRISRLNGISLSLSLLRLRYEVRREVSPR